MEEQQEAIITIDGTQYKASDLSDDAKAQLQSIQVAEAEMKRLNMLLAITQTARNAYAQALNAALPEKNDSVSH